MAITPGTRIGVYEVTSQLGEGAMGVVFRARDTKLLRDVALKVLPDHFADNPDRLARLEREAQLLASMNHPNIAQIYGLEQVGSSGCIVMELVEGETLDERLTRGPIPLDEALDITRQVGEALAAAHERGIVHRDLKPANIKLTPGGRVKVLDFGLAKALASVSVDPRLSTMPTSVGESLAGAVTGSPAYMSPEQARAKQIDSRSDIWALGCILFEMLTGQRAFQGETITDVLATIVTAPPDLSQLPSTTPPQVRSLLEAMLAKNAAQRLQHVGDMRLFLDTKLAPAAVVQTPSRRTPLLIGLAAAVVLLAIAAAFLYLRSPSPTPAAAAMRFELAFPPDAVTPQISPDGKYIGYTVRPADGASSIFVRAIDEETAQRINGTDNVTGWLWSPDSRQIAFIADGKLKKIDIAGGPAHVITEASANRGAAWGPNGVMLLARSSDNIIARFSDNGGEVKPLTSLDASRKETLHAVPAFLPDGNHFVYAVVSSIAQNAGIFVGSLDGMTPKRVLPLGERLNALDYASGYLLFAEGPLVARRFDVRTLTADEKPITLSEAVDYFSASDTGVLIYRKAASAAPTKELTWFDRTGKAVGKIGEPANYGSVELSPSGDRAVVDITGNGNRDVWVMDLSRGVPLRVTFDPSPEWAAFWSPDGSRIIYGAAPNSGGGTHIFTKSATGVGQAEPLLDSDLAETPSHVSPVGDYITFSRPKKGVANVPPYDTWVVTAREKKPVMFNDSPFDKVHTRISPDGRWIAFATNDSGMYQIVVQSFPDPNGGKWQITAQGGLEPKWRHDGRELYYLAFDGKLMAVPIKGDRVIEAGTPVPLFQTPLTVNRNSPSRDRRYDVDRNGRFLIAVPTGNAAAAPLTAVVNWTAGLEKK